MSLLRFLILGLIVLGVSTVVWYGWDVNNRWLYPAELQNLLEQTRDVITPPPLRGSLSGSGGELTRAGTLAATNEQRRAHGLRTLQGNATLDAVAERKLQDMFARQYFDHVAPDGTGPADVVAAVDYEYIRVGENLALGNFASDVALVQAWMDSPGHRANILHEGYTELGVAVGQGTFEGHQTWLAVQTFAKPASACSSVDAALRQRVESAQQGLQAQEKELAASQLALTTELSRLETEREQIEQLSAEGRRLIEAGNERIARGNETYKQTGDEAAAEDDWNEGKRLQAEGEAKLDQVRELQAIYTTARKSFRDQQRTYNEAIDAFKAGQTALQESIKQLNQQIAAFNACAER